MVARVMHLLLIWRTRCVQTRRVRNMPATSDSRDACLVLVVQRPVGLGLGRGVHERHALLLEAVMTFGLMYAVYATAVDHRSRGGGGGGVGAIAPLAIGFVLGANILAGGPFDGAGVRAGARRLELAPPLGLLGRAADRRRAGWRAVRVRHG